jgi:peptidoglycan/xylan/chitin deacetylase (PgdA/CDA1 family)
MVKMVTNRFFVRCVWRRVCVLVAVVLLGTVSPLAAGVGAAVAETVAHPAVVVSLTFDDGSTDQLQADTIMARYGMHGTFYVNSGRLTQPGYMSASQVVTLQSDGNEVAGHTVSHADLPTLTQDEATREVCNDRVNLLGLGLNVRNFAYPFGDNNAAVQQIVKNCGYNSARRVGDIVSPGTCSGCRYAESIPPANPYEVITPDSIKTDTSLLDMENYVLQAEQHGGGWVPLVMHHVCDGCNTLSITPALLDAFLAWLAPRAADGTIVKTIGDVIGGPLQAPVSGPLLPPPSPGNMLRNPSMEQIGSSGTPTCWQRGGYGTNTAAWSDTSDAQEGVNAQRVDITSLSSGDRKMISPQDLGGCAPPTVVGHTYLVQGWYKTNGMVRMVAYSRNSLGGWTWFAQGPTLASSAASYTHAAWTTPAMPAGSTAVSVGFSLSSVGFLQGDNMSLNDNNAQDSTPPTTTTSCNGLACSTSWYKNAVSVTLAATDPSPGSGVANIVYTTDGTDPTGSNGTVYTGAFTLAATTTVKYRAYDVAGNAETVRSIVLSIDTVPPTATVSSPSSGATVTGTTYIVAGVRDNVAVVRVWFYLDGKALGSRIVTPLQWKWDTTTTTKGTHTLYVIASDAAGNSTTSATTTVSVQ